MTNQPYNLVGPTVTGPVQDPLAVLLLDNRQNFHACAMKLDKGAIFEGHYL